MENVTKTLIVEDDFTSRLILQEFLKDYGHCHIAVNGKEAVAAVRLAQDQGEPYDLICLDIMMPEMDGQQALKEIRAMEDAAGIGSPGSSPGAKIVMITAMADLKNVIAARGGNANRSLCDGYLRKPIHKALLLENLRQLGLIP